MENQTDTDKAPDNGSDEKKIPIKAYTLKQLARLYGYSVQTVRKWIAPLHAKLGPRIGHFYNPRQIRIIFDHLGNPSFLFGLLLKWLLDGADTPGHDPDHDPDDVNHDAYYDGEKREEFRRLN